MKKLLLLSLVSFSYLAVLAQSDTSTIKIEGFVDAYFSYDFNKPSGQNRQDFFYNHNRHNSFANNLSLIKLSVDNNKYRANLGLQSGNYANNNYASENSIIRNIYEANVGIALDKKSKLWLDAGIMPSNLGFASPISSDNLTLTRSFTAENSPYFLSCAKLSYTLNKEWTLAVIASNGWQRIKRLNGNNKIATGTQLTYTKENKTTVHYGTFLGTDDPDSTARTRFFNNFYWQQTINPKWNFILSYDFGMQQQSKNANQYYYWHCATAIAQYKISQQWQLAARAETFNDPTEIINTAPNMGGNFRSNGYSLNLDYLPSKLVMCRIEGRYLSSPQAIYKAIDNTYKKNSFFITTSIAVKFGANLK